MHIKEEMCEPFREIFKDDHLKIKAAKGAQAVLTYVCKIPCTMIIGFVGNARITVFIQSPLPCYKHQAGLSMQMQTNTLITVQTNKNGAPALPDWRWAQHWRTAVVHSKEETACEVSQNMFMAADSSCDELEVSNTLPCAAFCVAFR